MHLCIMRIQGRELDDGAARLANQEAAARQAMEDGRMPWWLRRPRGFDVFRRHRNRHPTTLPAVLCLGSEAGPLLFSEPLSRLEAAVRRTPCLLWA